MYIRIKRLVSPVPREYVDADSLAHRARMAEERGMICGTAMERARMDYQLRLLEIALLDGVSVWRAHRVGRGERIPHLEEIPFLPKVPTTDLVLTGHVAFRYLPDSGRILLFLGDGQLPPPEELARWDEERGLRLGHLGYVIAPSDPDAVTELHQQHLRELATLEDEHQEVLRLCSEFDRELRAASGGRFDPALHESIAEWDDDRHLLRTGWVPREHREELRWLLL